MARLWRENSVADTSLSSTKTWNLSKFAFVRLTPSITNPPLQDMLTSVHPKLPMRDKRITRDFYVNCLGFEDIGTADYPGYLLLKKDGAELHFFEFAALDPTQNYGQVYFRTANIEAVYRHLLEKGISIHPAGSLQARPWGQLEFSLLDPDHNLLTFGQSL